MRKSLGILISHQESEYFWYEILHTRLKVKYKVVSKKKNKMYQ